MAKFDYTHWFDLYHSSYHSLFVTLRQNKNFSIPEYLNDSHLSLLFLVNREFGSSQKYLADKLFISKQSIGVNVEFLITKKYLIKIADPVDGRASLVKLTDKSWHLIEESKKSLKLYADECKEKIGTKNFKKLMVLLTELNR